MLFEEPLAGGDIERVVIDTKYSCFREKRNDCFECSSSGSSNIQDLIDISIVFVSLPDQSISIPGYLKVYLVKNSV